MRRRRMPTEEPANHDRWLISYSDLITTLFAFFVVLFATSYRDKKAVQGLSQAIHAGFQSLEAFPGGLDNTASYPEVSPGPPVDRPYTQRTTAPGDSVAPPGSQASAAPPIDLAQLQKQLDEAMGQEMKKHEIDTHMTPEGFVISLKELGFFSSGQATLMPGAAEKIGRIAKVLAQQGLDLRVEGHSDNQPIHTAEFRSNWELSTARAMAVMLMLVNDSGIDPGRISVAGYGQYKPIADDATPEGRKMNRRVDLVVVANVASPTPMP
jgi:chemotaxis protein MotB